MLAFVPAFTLAAFWFGGETALVVAALLYPLVLMILRGPTSAAETASHDPAKDSSSRAGLLRALDKMLADAANKQTAVFVLCFDDFRALSDRLGAERRADLSRRIMDRLAATLRADDMLVPLDEARCAIALSPVRVFDLELAIQFAVRLQSALEEPFSVDAGYVYVSTSIGFCTEARMPRRNAKEFLDAAERAGADAALHGPSAIRAFTSDMQAVLRDHHELADEVGAALENGQITAWFQPQINTSTGHVSGFEVLVRWHHPKRGIIAPGLFLPAIAQAGLLERLGEVMLFQALTALQSWDQAGYTVPSIGVNFSQDELGNPKLIDKIKWELDRFEIDPPRLSVEILETVVTQSDDDVVTRNIAALAQLGCGIDLDDFGTGHASISSIRRFDVSRIKIDRSFVMQVDRDEAQQKMIGAILSMADRLGLETLAEGVETIGEHAMLAQLGCDHIQGFGLARPMPFEKTGPWMDSHLEKIGPQVQLGLRRG
ncbi:bifunctional diguanylate cyclase/phosphodiesterase [Cognatishimia sp. MH4019]|uniref:putative bifunctional diguanylate cyclase/phosphodiesterase n=1 Tax=Cognatishimia sp. MH4019 TaxID=2854030 RepID=UPI001CD4758A|nr:GGDEF domain-containing phosphodiesterase [Cognatishimia sp. MH4019]